MKKSIIKQNSIKLFWRSTIRLLLSFYTVCLSSSFQQVQSKPDKGFHTQQQQGFIKIKF